jgi:hypothetical protein
LESAKPDLQSVFNPVQHLPNPDRFHDTIAQVHRISKGPEVCDILHSIDALRAFAREHGPGRYDVDEHSLDPFPANEGLG